MDRDALINVARTSLRTKLAVDIADKLTEVKDLVNIQRSKYYEEISVIFRPRKFANIGSILIDIFWEHCPWSTYSLAYM